MERAAVEAMLEAWHEARDRGGDAELDGPERGGIYHLVKIIEFKDGKVIRETRYFAEPFEAPQGWAKWTKGGDRTDPR